MEHYFVVAALAFPLFPIRLEGKSLGSRRYADIWLGLVLGEVNGAAFWLHRNRGLTLVLWYLESKLQSEARIGIQFGVVSLCYHTCVKAGHGCEVVGNWARGCL